VLLLPLLTGSANKSGSQVSPLFNGGQVISCQKETDQVIFAVRAVFGACPFLLVANENILEFVTLW